MDAYKARGELIICTDCRLERPKWIGRPDRRLEWAAICEECAGKISPIYKVHVTEDGGCQLIAGPSLEDCLRALTSAVEKDGARTVRGYRLLKIPGKHVYGSTVDHCRFGETVRFTVTSDAAVTAA